MAGVARTTVSYVMGGRKYSELISPEVAKRVREAAKKLNYLPNRRAQALALGKTRTVALLVDERVGEAWVWSRMMQGAQAALLREDHDVLVHAIADSEPVLAQARAIVRQGRADGVIAVPFVKIANSGKRLDFPFVWIDLGSRRLPYSVSHDPRPGLEEAVDHLRALGHKRIRWVGPKEKPQFPATNRSVLLREAAEARGISFLGDEFPLPVKGMGLSPLENQSVIVNHLRQSIPARPAETAVVCYNDFVAHCVSAVLREKGLRIPEDVSLTGFDDVQPAFHVPPLSTVNGAFAEMGEMAANHLLGLLVGEDSSSKPASPPLVANTFFAARGSTASPHLLSKPARMAGKKHT